MPFSTIGDMRQHILTQRHNATLKTDLNTLVQELTSGTVADVTAHLGGAQTHLSGVDRQLQMLQRFSQSNLETGQVLTTMQTALSAVDENRQSASAAMLSLNGSSSPSQVLDAGAVAELNFASTIQALNMRSGDRAMFGGNDLDGNPLADADIILDALRLEIAGMTTASDIGSAVDAWFDTPGGGFETLAYQGDTAGFVTRPIAAGQSIEIKARADDQAIRDTLKGLAKGALSADATVAFDPGERQAIQAQAGVDLLTEAAPMASLQARLGFVEGQVQEAAVRNAAQETSFSIARNDMVTADPFETATRLQSVQLQLETHYTLTARLSRLSLTEKLR